MASATGSSEFYIRIIFYGPGCLRGVFIYRLFGQLVVVFDYSCVINVDIFVMYVS